MSNFYIVCDKTIANVNIVNSLNSLAISSKNPDVETTAFVGGFRDLTTGTLVLVRVQDYGFAEMQNKIPFGCIEKLLVEVSPANYTTHKNTFDTLTNQVVYLNNSDFSVAYPSIQIDTIESFVQNN